MKEKMSLPPPFQVGIVVKNLSATIDYYTMIYGLGPFQVMHFKPTQHWVNNKPHPIELKVGKCQWGEIALELIEPVSENSPHQWFLDKKGEGMHHFGFLVENYDEWLDYFNDQGIDVLMNAETDVEGLGHVRAAYMLSDQTGGVLFELIEIT